MIKTSFFNQKKLPLVVEPAENCGQNISFESLIEISVAQKEFLQNKLLEHGALLFRGYSVDSPKKFGQFVRSFSGNKLLNYIGGASPRIELGGGVYTSTEYPSQYALSLHNELSYSDKFPEHVYFCCLIASKTGGETPLADSRRILKNIDREVVNQFKKRQIRYDRNLYGNAGSGFSWQDAFETGDKSIIENYLNQANINFTWRDDGSLRLSQIRPATTTHPVTGEEVWFNQADGFHPSALDAETYQSLISVMSEDYFRLNARFVDGAAFDVSMLRHIREVNRKEMVIFPWRKGDILVLDNLLTAHGRMPFTGNRKIILAMT